jgi:hypothetical protein
MNPPVDPQLEAHLKSLTWKPVPEEILSSSLQVALLAIPSGPPAVNTKRLNQWIPAPVRWTLAACWVLSLGLRLATPSLPPSPAGNSTATAAEVLHSLQITNDQIHELQDQLRLDHVAKR